MKTCFTRATCTVVMAGTLSPAAELYVAPDGNDTNPGTRAAPLKTLEAARDAIRNLKGEQPQLAGGATAWLRGGVYRITKTFELDERDSGTRYPKLAHTLDPSPDLRRGNEICGNVFVQSEGQRGGSGDEVRDNFATGEDPGFVDAAAMNFQLKPDSVVFTRIPGFRKIPFEKIGLYEDEHRKTVPARPADASTVLHPPERDVKTRQCAASFSNLESDAELPGQPGGMPSQHAPASCWARGRSPDRSIRGRWPLPSAATVGPRSGTASSSTLPGTSCCRWMRVCLLR